MPNFRETSPSKIATGFGGTLNLVLSALYITLVVLLTALPTHFHLLMSDETLQDTITSSASMQNWIVLGVTLAGLIGLAATIAPLIFGIRAFKALEFY